MLIWIAKTVNESHSNVIQEGLFNIASEGKTEEDIIQPLVAYNLTDKQRHQLLAMLLQFSDAFETGAKMN